MGMVFCGEGTGLMIEIFRGEDAVEISSGSRRSRNGRGWRQRGTSQEDQLPCQVEFVVFVVRVSDCRPGDTDKRHGSHGQLRLVVH